MTGQARADYFVASPATARYIRWFGEIGLDDIAVVGGKNASLGELYRFLVPVGVSVRMRTRPG